MEYITSRPVLLPASTKELEREYFFNMWKRRLWPYQELLLGDTLYWYETHSRRLVWNSHVSAVDRFPYSTKPIAKAKLQSTFGDFDETQPYWRGAPQAGYCLVWRVLVVERLDLSKPKDVRIPQQGWLRVDTKIARSWLSQTEPVDEVTLDDLASTGSLAERIHQLNASMKDISPKRVESIIALTIRRDTNLVRALKQVCEYRCQFPGCVVRIPKRNGGYYVEVAHIRPVSRGGRSLLGNLLVLCPNHHKEFDYGRLQIVDQTEASVRGTLNGRTFSIHLPFTES
jgi:hypothetical protein